MNESGEFKISSLFIQVDCGNGPYLFTLFKSRAQDLVVRLPASLEKAWYEDKAPTLISRLSQPSVTAISALVTKMIKDSPSLPFTPICHMVDYRYKQVQGGENIALRPPVDAALEKTAQAEAMRSLGWLYSYQHINQDQSEKQVYRFDRERVGVQIQDEPGSSQKLSLDFALPLMVPHDEEY